MSPSISYHTKQKEITLKQKHGNEMIMNIKYFLYLKLATRFQLSNTTLGYLSVVYKHTRRQ